MKPMRPRMLSNLQKAALLQALQEAMSAMSTADTDLSANNTGGAPRLRKDFQHNQYQDTSIQDGREDFKEYLLADEGEDDSPSSYKNLTEYLRGEPSAKSDTRSMIHGIQEEFKRMSDSKEEDIFQDDWEHARDEPTVMSDTSFCRFPGCITHGFQGSLIKEEKGPTMPFIKSCSDILGGRSPYKWERVRKSGAFNLIVVVLLVAIFCVIIRWAPNIKKILCSQFGCSRRPDGFMGYIDDVLTAMNID